MTSCARPAFSSMVFDTSLNATSTAESIVAGGTSLTAEDSTLVASMPRATGGLVRPTVASWPIVSGVMTSLATVIAAPMAMPAILVTAPTALSIISSVEVAEGSEYFAIFDSTVSDEELTSNRPALESKSMLSLITDAPVIRAVRPTAVETSVRIFTGSRVSIEDWPAMEATSFAAGASMGVSHARSPAVQ